MKTWGDGWSEAHDKMALRLAKDIHFETFLLNEKEDLHVIPVCNVPRGTGLTRAVCDILLERYHTVMFAGCYGEIEANVREWMIRSSFYRFSYYPTKPRIDLKTLPLRKKTLVYRDEEEFLYTEKITE